MLFVLPLYCTLSCVADCPFFGWSIGCFEQSPCSDPLPLTGKASTYQRVSCIATLFGADRERPARLVGHLILVPRSRLGINPTKVGCATAGFEL